MRAIAAPASLKEVLSAVAAAEALAAGLRAGGAESIAVPVADGGEGTLEVLGGDLRDADVSAPLGGRVRACWSLQDDGTAVVESAQALGFQTVSELDPVRASSRGLGELILAAAREAETLLVCLGGTVTVDGGAGMREVLDELPLPTRVACDVLSPLLDTAYVFAGQKGATEGQLDSLAERLRGLPDAPGSGAAGGPRAGDVRQPAQPFGQRVELPFRRSLLSREHVRGVEQRREDVASDTRRQRQLVQYFAHPGPFVDRHGAAETHEQRPRFMRSRDDQLTQAARRRANGVELRHGVEAERLRRLDHRCPAL